MSIIGPVNNSFAAASLGPIDSSKVNSIASSIEVSSKEALKDISSNMPTADEAERMIKNGEAKATQSFVQDSSTFTLFKLPNGVLYTRVRDLNTGDVQYFPNIDDTFSFMQALQPEKGLTVERKA